MLIKARRMPSTSNDSNSETQTDTQTGLKSCSVCNQWLPAVRFTKTQYTKTTRKRKCKKCTATATPAVNIDIEDVVQDHAISSISHQDQNSASNLEVEPNVQQVPRYFVDRTKMQVPGCAATWVDHSGRGRPIEVKVAQQHEEECTHTQRTPNLTYASAPNTQAKQTKDPCRTIVTSGNKTMGISNSDWENFLANNPKLVSNMSSLQHHLGYNFKDKHLLYKALTTPMTLNYFRDSTNGPNKEQMQILEDNGKLQILGSSVYRLVVSQFFYAHPGNIPEGNDLESMITFYENISSLLEIAKAKGLSDALICMNSEMSNPSNNVKSLPFYLLALYGSIFVDGGFSTVSRIILKDLTVLDDEGEIKTVTKSPAANATDVDKETKKRKLMSEKLPAPPNFGDLRKKKQKPYHPIVMEIVSQHLNESNAKKTPNALVQNDEKLTNVVNNNATSRLNELAQRTGLKLDFNLVEESGPPHCKTFSFSANINGAVYGTGKAQTKKTSQGFGGKPSVTSFGKRDCAKINTNGLTKENSKSDIAYF
uniref:DRBM domain-containing protein n=1 Tax=Aplanochytrium stocchinoi TaxID=215587 RepID=A0A7S3LQE2_9STRA